MIRLFQRHGKPDPQAPSLKVVVVGDTHGAHEALGTLEGDVPITHTPPFAAPDLGRPRLHCFGHVHASGGSQAVGPTLHVNACTVNGRLEMTYPPFIFEMPRAGGPVADITGEKP